MRDCILFTHTYQIHKHRIEKIETWHSTAITIGPSLQSVVSHRVSKVQMHRILDIYHHWWTIVMLTTTKHGERRSQSWIDNGPLSVGTVLRSTYCIATNKARLCSGFSSASVPTSTVRVEMIGDDIGDKDCHTAKSGQAHFPHQTPCCH